VKCEEPFPYFNLESKLCQSCVETTYNKETRECEDSQGKGVGRNPTLEQMLARIF
jgi:hypothetical protein